MVSCRRWTLIVDNGMVSETAQQRRHRSSSKRRDEASRKISHLRVELDMIVSQEASSHICSQFHCLTHGSLWALKTPQLGDRHNHNDWCCLTVERFSCLMRASYLVCVRSKTTHLLPFDLMSLACITLCRVLGKELRTRSKTIDSDAKDDGLERERKKAKRQKRRGRRDDKWIIIR